MIQRCRLKPSAYIHSSGCSSARCVSTRSGRFHAPKSNQLRAQEVVTLPWGGVRTRNNFGTSSSSLLRQTLSHHLDNQLSMKFSTFTKSEYIHPLSQIVLEHLQSHHSLWVTRMGLDTGLQLNKDGTFALRFPPSLDDAIKTSVIGNDEESSPGAIYGSIWTMYETTEKKHYLCVTKGNIVGRYMLQDNTKPAWHSDKRSTPERVKDAVDEMIEKLEKEGNRRVL